MYHVQCRQQKKADVNAVAGSRIQLKGDRCCNNSNDNNSLAGKSQCPKREAERLNADVCVHAKVSAAGKTRPKVLPKCFIICVQKDSASLFNILHLYAIFVSAWILFFSLATRLYLLIFSTEMRLNMYTT